MDCSVAVRWLLPDEATPYTDAVFELLNAQDVVVPALFLSEFSNVFLKLSRQRRLSSELALNALQRFSALGLEVDRHTPAPTGFLPLPHNMVCRLTTQPTLSLRCGSACRWPVGMAASKRLRKRPDCF